MKNVRLFWSIVKRCRFEKILFGFLISYFVVAAIMLFVEPGIDRYGEALWYVFVSCTTIGFGDLTATTLTGRLLTVYITIYEIVLVAILSGVIISHYIEVIHRREKLTATMFLDRLKHLTELSPEELAEMERKVREFDR